MAEQAEPPKLGGPPKLRVRLAGEDQMHRSLGRGVVERVAGSADFEGIDGGGDFLIAKGMRDRLRQRLNLPPHKPLFLANIDALRGHAEANELADTIRISEMDAGEGHLIVLLADTDGQPSRSAAIDAARKWFLSANRKAAALIIGAPHRDAEAWVVAGLAEDDGDQLLQQRTKARRALGFDPCDAPDRLTSAPNHADTDAKRVLAFLLSDGDHPRHQPSASPPFDTHDELLARAFLSWPKLLRAEGANATGLAQFAQEIAEAAKRARQSADSLFSPG